MTTGRRIHYIVSPPANQSLFSNIAAADDDEDDDAKLLANFELAKARLYQDYVTARNTVFPVSFSTPSKRSRTPSSGSSLDTQGIPHITPIGSLDSSTDTAATSKRPYTTPSEANAKRAKITPEGSTTIIDFDAVNCTFYSELDTLYECYKKLGWNTRLFYLNNVTTGGVIPVISER
jgi:hypothetical protein